MPKSKDAAKKADKAKASKPKSDKKAAKITAKALRRDPAAAREESVALAKAIAPDVAAPLGRVAPTKYRGDPTIFGRLVEDHDRHRALIAMIGQTSGASPDRQALFEELTRETKAHAAAEEQALWSTVLRKPAITADGRHAVAEHKELDDLFNDLAARDMSSSGWLNRFHTVSEEYLHHILEEEQELFVSVEPELSDADKRYMRGVFARRKKEEKAAAKLEPKRKPSLDGGV